MRRTLVLGVIALFALATLAASTAYAQGPQGKAMAQANMSLAKELQELLNSDKVSPQTKTCIQCHIQYTPGIVYDWLRSKHAHMPAAAAGKIYDMIGQPQWKDKISPKFKNYKYVVGCYECHGMFKVQDRPDIINNHFGFKIVTIVTKKDCSQCHPKEAAEISWTWHAIGTLHSPFKPWYLGILKWAKEHGANPFGNATAKALYEKYFPPYLVKQRDKDEVDWNFYKDIAKAIFDYLNGKATEQDKKIISMLKQATGMITPYDMDFKNWISPLWPASGVLNTTLLERNHIKITVTSMTGITKTLSNIMQHPSFKNGYFYHACLECHGSIVIPYKKETVELHGLKVNRVDLWGWPNNGAARVDPDGSIGTCTACHPRHTFSVKQARKPWTCGQCHLGYDHPHIEIYEESKHGNIENAYGSHWNWEHLPWRVGVDFNAPTCATCHMSTIAVEYPNGTTKIVVPGTHDLEARLVWDQMHFFAIPKPIIPDKIQLALFYGWSQLKGTFNEIAQHVNKEAPPQYRYPVFMGVKIISGPKPGEVKFPRLDTFVYTGELAKHREEMKAVCKLCHSSQWTDNFFRTADQNIEDYDVVAKFAFGLLKLAWKEGVADPHNLLDEFPEIMWYYIWHHQGRRWKNGAFMMGPDYAHWFGIVDTVMEALGKMTNWVVLSLKVKMLETELQALKQQAAGAPYSPELAAQIAQLQREIEILKQQIAALEAQVPVLKSQISSLETGFTATQTDIASVKENVNTLVKQLEELSKQLQSISPQAAEIQKMVQQIQQITSQLQQLQKETKTAVTTAQQASTKAEEAGRVAKSAYSLAEEISKKIDDLNAKIGSMSKATYILAGLAIALAAIAIGLAAARRS